MKIPRSAVHSVVIVLLAMVLSGGCVASSANKDFVRQNAEARWRQLGYEVIGYEGFAYSQRLWGDYGGACVWYTVRRIADNGIIYSGCLQRWGEEIHLYSLKALDAIKP